MRRGWRTHREDELHATLVEHDSSVCTGTQTERRLIDETSADFSLDMCAHKSPKVSFQISIIWLSY